MRFKIFTLEGNDLTINKPEVLLIPEFATLWNIDRNKCKEDKTGKERLLASKELKYIWLSQDFTSNYQEMSLMDRIQTSLDDSGLTAAQAGIPEMVAAINRYNQLQDTKTIRLLKSAYLVIDKLEDFFKTVDLTERDDNNKLVHSSKDAIANLSNLGKVVEGLETLEYQVKKEKQAEKAIRGDASPGLYD
jgi:hypothetical protein